MAGTVAFAVTAVLAVAPRGIDIFGILVLGVITAIGGGTLRDVIIDAPVFWGADLTYIWVAVAASAPGRDDGGKWPVWTAHRRDSNPSGFAVHEDGVLEVGWRPANHDHRIDTPPRRSGAPRSSARTVR